MHRPTLLSGGGSNGQSSVVGTPVESVTASVKENIQYDSPEKKPYEPPPELSEKSSISASPEDLEAGKVNQGGSKFESVDSYVSLPDLLLPEAAYKKQSDTDTDTADYESAADTYESATETDLSEAVTPSEKYASQVFDEAINIQDTTASAIVDSSTALLRKDSSSSNVDETYSKLASDATPITNSTACTEDESDKLKESSISVIHCDTNLNEVALLKEDEISSSPVKQETNLSLCEAFRQLSLDSPSCSSFVQEVDKSGEALTSDDSENNENFFSALNLTYCDSPSIISEVVSFIPLPEKEEIISLQHKLSEEHILSNLNSLQEEQSALSIPHNKDDCESTQKFIHEDTDVSKVAENNSPTVESPTDINLLSLNSCDNLDVTVIYNYPEVTEGTKPPYPVKVPDEETENLNIPSLDNKALDQAEVPDEKTEISNIPENEFVSKNSSGPPLQTALNEKSVEIKKDCTLYTELVVADKGKLDPTGDANDTSHFSLNDSSLCIATEPCINVQSDRIAAPSKFGLDDTALLGVPVNNSGKCIVETPVSPGSSEEYKVCSVIAEGEFSTEKSEVEPESSRPQEENSIFIRAEDNSTLSFLHSIHENIIPDVQSSETEKFHQLSSLEVVVASVDILTPSGQQSHELLFPDSSPSDKISSKQLSFHESSVTVEAKVEFRPINESKLEVKENWVQSTDAEKLDQLIEICNRQQEDLNQNGIQFVQESLVNHLLDNVDSCDKLKYTCITSPEKDSILNFPELQEEKGLDIASNEEVEFEDIALEASKIVDSILHSTDYIDLDSESDNLSSSKMADSEEFSVVNTRSPVQSKITSHCAVPHSEKQSLSNAVKLACHDSSKGTPPALSSIDVNEDKGKGISKKLGSPEVNQSEAGPDIADDVHCKAEDVFKDASAFDFLSAIGSTQAADDLRKQSLYVKFDPLVESMSQSEKIKPSPPSAEQCRERISSVSASGGSKALELVDKLISVTPSPKKRDQEIEDKRSVSSIPKELIPVKKEEAVLEVAKPKQQPVESENSNEETMHLQEELERLKDLMREESAGYEQEKEALNQKIREIDAEKRAVEDSERRKDRLLAEKSQSLSQMSIILEEYEKTISRLVGEKEHEKQALSAEITRLTKEKDTMSTHLENIEIAFSDVHQKYEKSKQVIQGFVKNEEALRASLAEYESTIKKQEQKYELLKNHAMTQLEGANEELNTLHRNHQVELTKLRAMLKKAELKVTSLEELVEQKTKENQELVTICDELIGNVEPK